MPPVARLRASIELASRRRYRSRVHADFGSHAIAGYRANISRINIDWRPDRGRHNTRSRAIEAAVTPLFVDKRPVSKKFTWRLSLTTM
jgi:hypothetical protein